MEFLSLAPSKTTATRATRVIRYISMIYDSGRRTRVPAAAHPAQDEWSLNTIIIIIIITSHFTAELDRTRVRASLSPRSQTPFAWSRVRGGRKIVFPVFNLDDQSDGPRVLRERRGKFTYI